MARGHAGPGERRGQGAVSRARGRAVQRTQQQAASPRARGARCARTRPRLVAAASRRGRARSARARRGRHRPGRRRVTRTARSTAGAEAPGHGGWEGRGEGGGAGGGRDASGGANGGEGKRGARAKQGCGWAGLRAGGATGGARSAGRQRGGRRRTGRLANRQARQSKIERERAMERAMRNRAETKARARARRHRQGRAAGRAARAGGGQQPAGRYLVHAALKELGQRQPRRRPLPRQHGRALRRDGAAGRQPRGRGHCLEKLARAAAVPDRNGMHRLQRRRGAALRWQRRGRRSRRAGRRCGGRVRRRLGEAGRRAGWRARAALRARRRRRAPRRLGRRQCHLSRAPHAGRCAIIPHAALPLTRRLRAQCALGRGRRRAHESHCQADVTLPLGRAQLEVEQEEDVESCVRVAAGGAYNARPIPASKGGSEGGRGRQRRSGEWRAERTQSPYPGCARDRHPTQPRAPGNCVRARNPRCAVAVPPESGQANALRANGRATGGKREVGRRVLTAGRARLTVRT